MIQQNTLTRLTVIFLALWLGMQIMAGYIAAPILFQLLPKMQAGEIAGKLFDILSWIGLVVWAGAFFTQYRIKTAPIRFITWVWILIDINQFVVTPVIEAHKNGTSNWLLSLLGGSFGAWHGVSSVIFMLCAILAGVSVWKISKLLD